MQEIILQKSSNKDKKFDAFVEGKKVSFGDSQYKITPNIRMMKEGSSI